MVLILVFVCQIVGIVSLVGYLSFRNGQKTVNALATQLRRELTARIERELRGYFETPHEINRLNASAFVHGDLDVLNATYGESQMYQQMKVSPTVALVYCGSARNGEFFGVLRSPDDGSLQLTYSNPSTQFLRHYYSLNVYGDRTYFLRQSDQPYDSRQRPWFKAATIAQQPIWTNIYIAFTTGLPNITASLPIYDRSERKLLGVCATDVVLPEEFRTFLRNLEIGINGQAFVIDRNGDLISNSTDEPLMVDKGETTHSLAAVNSQDMLVKGTAQYLVDRFGSFKAIIQTQRLDFQLNGERQFLEVVPFSDGYGLDWLIVVVVPEADFMEQINANTLNTILLCLIALGVAIGIGILTGRWLTRPILEVCHASEEIAKGNLAQQVNPYPIREIQQLANSFNSMADQLKTSFEALHQSESTNRAIVSAIPDLLIRASGDGTYLDIVGSDRLLNIYGFNQFSPGSSVKQSLPQEIADLRLHHIRKALETGELQVYEQRIQINDKPQDEEVRVLVLGKNEVLIMVRDITSRKRAEEALRIAEENYRSIYENALEGIFQSSPDGYFISVNPTMAEMYGYHSPNDMVQSITDIPTQVYVDLADQIKFRRRLAEDDHIKNFEYRVYRKDGSIFWIQEDTRAVRDNSGNLMYYEGIVQDVSDRKRQEAELKRQLEELKIEIDQNKRKTEVTRITESGYFQEIQEEISNVNLNEFWS
jgi:PAS domain S-box-containing protein